MDDGLAGFDFAAGSWVFREAPLSQFVLWALHGQLVPTPVLPRYRRVYRVIDGKRRRFRRSQWWTSLQSVGDQKKHEAMRQRQEAAKAEREAREEEAERRRAERLRKQQEEASRARWEEIHRQWAEEAALRARERTEKEARLAQEQAEREEIQRQVQATARAWWSRLSSQQKTELFTAATARFDPALRRRLPPQALARAWDAYRQQFGRYVSHGQPKDTATGAFTVVASPCAWSTGPASSV